MRYVEVGGVRISSIGLGTWQFGSREWGYGETYAKDESARIVRRALDLGIDLIDTAEIYAFGRSERIVGEAIRDRREDVFLATKILPVMPLAGVVERRARASARRLGVDRIDLYQIHWPNPAIPIGAQMEGMRRIQRTGLIGHAGVSNFSLERWEAAERALGGPVLSNQVNFSLAVPKPMHDLVPYAERAGRLVIAYSPLAKGLLSGRYDAAHRPTGSVRRGGLFRPESLERASGLIAVLREVAEPRGASPAQVALAWLIRRPNVVAIPGASSVAQVESNASAADLDLSDDEDLRLTEASERFASGPR
jgi:aryl-alcohol dehydrogenase-like predicted oxidoreductase